MKIFIYFSMFLLIVFFMLRFVLELKKFQTANFILTDKHVCGCCFETGMSGTWMRVLKQLKFKRMQQNNRDWATTQDDRSPETLGNANNSSQGQEPHTNFVLWSHYSQGNPSQPKSPPPPQPVKDPPRLTPQLPFTLMFIDIHILFNILNQQPDGWCRSDRCGEADDFICWQQ